MGSPRNIWMYWHSGVTNAPPLVRICIESWQRRNPDWTVRVLDDASLANWVDMHDVRDQNPNITIQAFSDVLRWRLLKQHGGVWADATLYCNRPLEDWLLNQLQKAASFVFRTEEIFLLHSWFIAARADSSLVSAMSDQVTVFTCRYGGFRHYFELRGLWRIYNQIEKRLGRGNYFIWRSRLFRQFLKASPYFFQNYLLGYLVTTNSECRREFNTIEMTYGEAPHALQQITQDGKPPSLEAVQQLLVGDCPVQKLTLKRYVPEWSEGGILDLLESYTGDV